MEASAGELQEVLPGSILLKGRRQTGIWSNPLTSTLSIHITRGPWGQGAFLLWRGAVAMRRLSRVQCHNMMMEHSLAWSQSFVLLLLWFSHSNISIHVESHGCTPVVWARSRTKTHLKFQTSRHQWARAPVYRLWFLDYLPLPWSSLLPVISAPNAVLKL